MDEWLIYCDLSAVVPVRTDNERNVDIELSNLLHRTTVILLRTRKKRLIGVAASEHAGPTAVVPY